MTSHKTPAEIVEEFNQLYLAEFRWRKDRMNNLSAEDWLLTKFQEQEEEVRRDEREKCEREKDWAVHDATSKLQ